MIKRKKKSFKDDDAIQNEDDYMSEFDDDLNEFNDDFENDFDDDFDDFDIDDKSAQSKMKERQKNFYVKKEDLIAEIQKYNNSKATSEDGRGKISEDLRNHDHEDLH